MKIPYWLNVYGDIDYRNKNCPTEQMEMVTFVSYVRRKYPETHGKLLVHVRNEGVRSWGQAQWQKAEGMTKGVPDIIIPATTPFLCELKRADHTLSRWQEGQIEYLEEATKQGCFTCVAFGHKAAIAAVEAWNVICGR